MGRVLRRAFAGAGFLVLGALGGFVGSLFRRRPPTDYATDHFSRTGHTEDGRR